MKNYSEYKNNKRININAFDNISATISLRNLILIMQYVKVCYSKEDQIFSSYFRIDAILGASSMEVRQEFQIPENGTLKAEKNNRALTYSYSDKRKRIAVIYFSV